MNQAQIPNVLACDVGNSRIRLAIISGEQTSEIRELRIGQLDRLQELISELWEECEKPRKIAACSVNPTGLKALEAAASEAVKQNVLVVGRDLPLPIDTALPEPDRIGTDRLCGAAAAFDRLGTACVVADFGTAITIDCVDDEGVFRGGSILPGLAMSRRSLASETAQLPEVEQVQNPDWVFGKNTDQAIAGGVVFAARGALRHLVEAYATELQHWPLVIVTGGDAKTVCENAEESELVQAYVPELVLRGIAMSYYRSLLK